MATNDTLNWKKKKWVAIHAPAQYENTYLGETLVMENKLVLNKPITVNVMHLTKNVKKQNLNLTFKVTDIVEGKATTKAVAFEMQPASIKRLVRGGRDRVDESFIVKSKDAQYARVKPLFITKNHQPSTVKTKLRRLTISIVRKYVAEVAFEDFMKDVVDGKVQKIVRDKLVKITPLRNCEIRVVELIENFTALKARKLEKRAAKEQINEEDLKADDAEEFVEEEAKEEKTEESDAKDEE
ncbi:MAG TPA: hypothetical protein VK158_02410 [Acidobacteriota bacterium]|nr:hypothetical protein [Acidobacteriota bacterium]